MSITFASFSTAGLQQGIADILLTAASQHPTSGVYVAPGAKAQQGEFLSYPALLEEAQRILGGLRNCASHSRNVALLLERPRDFIPAFWACILGGYIPCPMAPIRGDGERWAKHLAHVHALLDQPLFVATGPLLTELPSSVTSIDLSVLREGAASTAVHQAAHSDPAIFMLTSGSTGNAKAVELTHANLLASMAGRAARQKLTAADITFNWIAFDHVAALLESHMIALYVGATQIHTEPAAVLSEPLQFLRLIHRHRVSIAFAPNFLLGQINAALLSAGAGSSAERKLAVDLSCLRRIVTGGEANVVETGRRFLELLAPYGLPRNALWPAFGMTETCAASVYSHEFPERDLNSEFASVGLPIEGLEIRIVDKDGANVPMGDTGEMQLRGPVILHRYHNNEAATLDAFTADGWFRTGDLGRLEDGRLRLVARSKDSIIVSGVNYFSHELETQLEQLDSIERSFVAAFPTRPKGADTEQLVVTFATTLAPGDEEGLYQLLVAVRNTTIMLWGFRPAAILPLPRDAFPKTSLGKIQRSLMRQRFEAAEFRVHAEQVAQITNRQLGPYVAPEGPVEHTLVEIFSRILGIDAAMLSTTVSFFDLGGTSLDILKLTHSLEQRFGLKAEVVLILQNPTVRQLAARIAAKARHESGVYEPIVPLQVTGKRTPLFCVHPGNGEVLVLVNLAKYFYNDRPFYALRPRGFNAGEECFKTVEEAVSTYLAAILQRQPKGPYAIAGYSLGAGIAFELAKRLEARGCEVAFLGCIDFPPWHKASSVDFIRISTGLAFVLDLVNQLQLEQLRADLYANPLGPGTCQYILQRASASRLAELDLDLERFSVWARVAHSMEDMLYGHVTTGRINAMTVFHSAGLPAIYSKADWQAQLRRWDEFTGNSKFIAVPGDHHTLMSPKHVAAFQAAFRDEIDAAMKER